MKYRISLIFAASLVSIGVEASATSTEDLACTCGWLKNIMADACA